MTAHTPTEWAAALCLGLAVWGVGAAAIWLTAEAERSDFDPRPALRRALESGHFDRLLIVVGPVLHDARRVVRLSLRDAAVSVAALLTLLNPTTPESLR